MLIQDVVSISKAQLRIESKIQHPRQGRDAYLPINHCIPLDQKKISLASIPAWYESVSRYLTSRSRSSTA